MAFYADRVVEDASEETPSRYFVTVAAPHGDALRELGQRGLDLFVPTAVATADAATIDGHLDFDAIRSLADDGYTVTVHGVLEPVPLEIAESLTSWAADQGIEMPGVEEFDR